MEYKILPLFKSHFSIGRSILTLEDESSSAEDSPDSVFALCKENSLEEIYLVEDSMSGALQAITNAKNNKVKLNFGLRITLCKDMNEKSDKALDTNSKFVIFCKNVKGYKNLIKIYSLAAKDGFYYEPRIDYSTLQKMWSDDLFLCVPFYDSYVFNNLFNSDGIIPELFTKAYYFKEDNDHPLDKYISKFLSSQPDIETVKTKSIYYHKKNDFISYLTFRAINNRSSLSSPKLNHMCSDEFCFESWKGQNK